MNALKIMATIDGALYEVEAKQTDPLHPRFEIIHQGKQLTILRKENGKWLAETMDCLMPEEVASIGKTIDNDLNHRF